MVGEKVNKNKGKSLRAKESYDYRNSMANCDELKCFWFAITIPAAEVLPVAL